VQGESEEGRRRFHPRKLKLAYKVAHTLGSTIEEVFTFEDEDLA